MVVQSKLSSQDPVPATPSTDVVVDAQASVGAQGVQDHHPQSVTPHVPLVNRNGNGNGNTYTQQEQPVPIPVNGQQVADGTPAARSPLDSQPTGGETVAQPDHTNGVSTAGQGQGDVGSATVPQQNGEATDEKPANDLLIVDADPQDQAAWKTISYDDEVPLLDLDETRTKILQVDNELDAEAQMLQLANEYKHYFWNQIISEERRKLLKKKYVTDIFGNKADQRVAMTLEEQRAADKAPTPAVGSLYGESLIFKLRCDDKNPKKDTPAMTDEEDVVFVEKIHEHLKKIQQRGMFLKSFTSVFAFELTPYIIAKMIMSSEIKNKHVENLCVEILLICAEHGNHREMDLQVRNTVTKFDSNHFEGLSFHGVTKIMRVWGAVVSQIERKRAGFVLKMLKNYDRMLPAAEGHRNTFYFEEDCPELDVELPDIMVDTYEKLLVAQEKQWKGNETLQKACTVNGCLKGTKSRAICQLGSTKGSSYRQRSPDKLGNKASKKDPPQLPEQILVDDWLAERHYILVSALTLLKEIVYNLALPPQETEGKKESKKERNARRNNQARIKKIMHVLKKLGFTNTLRGIQLSSLYTFNEPMLPEHKTLQEGFGPAVKFTIGSKYTALSHASTSVFFFLSLIKEENEGRLEFTLDKSGFQYLTKKRQFETAMPYIMSLLTLSPKICTVAAMRLTKLFGDDGSKELWKDEDTHLWRFGLMQSGRPVSLCGMTMQMARMVERLDDKRMRAGMYETFQMLLMKIKSPKIRFGIVNQLITETRRIELEAQFITELKDVIAYADECDEEIINADEREDMRMSFVQNLYPRYFMPRKDSLAVLSPMMALTMSTLFLAIRDKNNINTKCGEERKGVMKMFVKMAKEIFRSVCKCAEHDMKKIPQEMLKKDKAKLSHFNVAKKTLGEGMTGISTIERIADILEGKED